MRVITESGDAEGAGGILPARHLPGMREAAPSGNLGLSVDQAAKAPAKLAQ